MKAIAGFLLTAAVLVLSGCNRECGCETRAGGVEREFAGARLSKTDVVRMARAAGAAKGIKVADYDEPSVEFDPKDSHWFLMFIGRNNGKEAIPGNHFSVSIEDRTGKTEVHRGL